MKYLGLIIESGLTWSSHIDTLCSRLSSACFALSRLRPSLNTDNVKKAYYGYFHSLLAYGVDLWENAEERERAFRSQRRAMRVVAGVPSDSIVTLEICSRSTKYWHYQVCTSWKLQNMYELIWINSRPTVTLTIVT